MEIDSADLGSVEEALGETSEYGFRHLGGFHAGLVATVAAGWSIFQLLLPQFILLSSEYVRTFYWFDAVALEAVDGKEERRTNSIGHKLADP